MGTNRVFLLLTGAEGVERGTYFWSLFVIWQGL